MRPVAPARGGRRRPRRHDPAGHAIVVWRRFATHPGLGAADISGRLFDPSGVGFAPFRVRDPLDPDQDTNRLPQVAMDDAGRYVVVWMENLNGTETAVGRGCPALLGAP